MKNIEIKVSNCLECNFCNKDNEYGSDSCNLNTSIVLKDFEQLPSDKVHEDCPLKNNTFTIMIK